jgi:hypothetical protein
MTFGSCEPTTPYEECVGGCLMAEQDCAARGESAVFQRLLTCLTSLSCEGAGVVNPVDTQCAAEIQAVEEQCSNEGVMDAGCCDDLPLIDVGADTGDLDASSDVEVDSPSADAILFEAGVDSPVRDAPVETGRD